MLQVTGCLGLCYAGQILLHEESRAVVPKLCSEAPSWAVNILQGSRQSLSLSVVLRKIKSFTANSLLLVRFSE